MLGLDVGVCRATVEAHLRALSPLYSELVDFVQADLVRAEPSRFFRQREHADA